METRLELPPPSADTRLAAAWEAVEGGEVKFLSLDVFDTLLFRTVPEPVDAFELVERRLHDRRALAPDLVPGVFARLRAAAERRARERRAAAGEGVEVTLAEIHAQLPAALFSRPVDARELEQAECDAEAAILVPDLDVAALARAAQERGIAVVAISDTYFSQRHLRLFLARGPLASVRFDRVFASSDHGAGKAGGLFAVVLDQLDAAPEDVLHVGDNHESDVLPARRLGIRAAYFDRRPPALARVVERERAQLEAAPAAGPGDHGLTALRAKALHRDEGARQPAGLRPFWDFGAAGLGPAFAGFADWVSRHAERAGVSKAFCLMREGELLARMVNAARPEGAAPLAEPLWVSRQVVLRASIREATPDELAALFDRRVLPTVREFCASLGIGVDELPGFAARAGRRIDDHALGDELIEAIAFDPGLRARVVASSQALRRRLVRYVESRRPAGEPRLLLVDLGWAGTIQAGLEEILREGGVDVRTVGLYLVTYGPALGRALDGVEMHGFLGAFGVPGKPVEAIARGPELLEQVCMPDSGSQTDLTEDLQPVLAPAADPSLQAVERAAVQQGILAFQREWLRYRRELPGALGELDGAARRLLLAMVTRAVAAPTGDEAALFAGWLHDENLGTDRVESIASGPAAKALGHMDAEALIETPMSELYWPFGLAGLQDPHLADAVAAVAGGVLPAGAVSSELETGDFEVQADLGWGFEGRAAEGMRPRRNRRGLSYVRADLRGEYVQRLRLRPAERPCVLRLDWVRLRCRVHGGEAPVQVDLEDAEELGRLRLGGGARWLAPKLLLVTGERSWLVLDLRRLVEGKVYEAVVEVGFAALPLARSQARERFARVRDSLLRWAKETRAGAPLRWAGRLVRRLRGR
jgi:FMN phosphatase YigB (HAD superfamily)